jgi:hypothetical protein
LVYFVPDLGVLTRPLLAYRDKKVVGVFCAFFRAPLHPYYYYWTWTGPAHHASVSSRIGFQSTLVWNLASVI